MTTSGSRRLPSLRWILVAANAVLAVVVAHACWRDSVPARGPEIPTTTLQTPHYAITSSATPAQAKVVAGAVESLYAAYTGFFGSPSAATRPRLQLRLYRDRSEFKAHNRSAPWAEAYYASPVCHAYYASDEPNPYHWMIHEATHQLDNEVAHLKKRKWIDEGLAAYFGTSTIRGGRLRPGEIDTHTYPVWWLPRLALSGDLDADIRAGRIIPLHALVSGNGGPGIDRNVNAYYIGYWSLSHFLFHYDGGRYAAAYRALIAEGGSVEDFERRIGPIPRVQAEWYGYLRQTAASLDETPLAQAGP